MEYIEKLREHLNVMPQEEQDRIVDYYKNIILQAQDPDEMIKSLGTPSEVAANVLSEYIKRPKRKSRGMLIFIIASFPIWLPIVAAIFSIIFTIVIVIVTFAITGVGLLILSPFLLFSDFSNGLLALGAALMISGVVMLIFKPAFGLFRKTTGGIFFSASRAIRRVNNEQ